MRVLFVGEGDHDIGPPAQIGPPRPARGVVPALCRLICPEIGAESVAMSWRDLSSYDLSSMRVKKRDLLGAMYVRQMKIAGVLGPRKFQCDGAICVIDRDGDPDRVAALERGRQEANEIAPDFRMAAGVAVESIEAWTLGDPDALATALGLSADRLQYKVGEVESMKQSSGKEERRPKALLQKCAETANNNDCLELREKVAMQTDIAKLARNCSEGFGPFANDVRKTFCPYRDTAKSNQ